MSKGSEFYYCGQAIENDCNVKILLNILDDLRCVIKKTLGIRDDLEGKREEYERTVERLKAELKRLQQELEELHRKLHDLCEENEQLRNCLAEQCRKIRELEAQIAQLKDEIARQEGIIAQLKVEKLELLRLAKQLQAEIDNCRRQIKDEKVERDRLCNELMAYERIKQRIPELQRALAECCERCDCLQRENDELRQQICCLESNLDVVEQEKKEVCAAIQDLKIQFQEEKARLEEEICRLLEEQAQFQREKAEMCRSTNETLRTQHKEMDMVKDEVNMYLAQLDKERRERNELDRKLRARSGCCAILYKSRSLGGGLCQRRGSACGNDEASLRRQLEAANARAQEMQCRYEREASEKQRLEDKLKGQGGNKTRQGSPSGSGGGKNWQASPPPAASYGVGMTRTVTGRQQVTPPQQSSSRPGTPPTPPYSRTNLGGNVNNRSGSPSGGSGSDSRNACMNGSRPMQRRTSQNQVVRRATAEQDWRSGSQKEGPPPLSSKSRANLAASPTREQPTDFSKKSRGTLGTEYSDAPKQSGGFGSGAQRPSSTPPKSRNKLVENDPNNNNYNIGGSPSRGQAVVYPMLGMLTEEPEFEDPDVLNSNNLGQGQHHAKLQSAMKKPSQSRSNNIIGYKPSKGKRVSIVEDNNNLPEDYYDLDEATQRERYPWIEQQPSNPQAAFAQFKEQVKRISMTKGHPSPSS